jgi:hypothetical protein
MRTLGIAFFCALLANAGAALPNNKSISLSKQFVVYCDDLPTRQAVTSFADETKNGLLALLGLRDQWKYPIVINVGCTAAGTSAQPASVVRMFEVEDGLKVQVDAWIGADPAAARFAQQIVHAVLLELAYRDTDRVRSGSEFNQPPIWLIDGAAQQLQVRDAGMPVELFRTLLDSNHLPPIKNVLEESSDHLEPASRELHDTLSLALVQLLIDQPEGRAALAAYVRELPVASGLAEARLTKHFPALGGAAASLEKWWALSIARLSASDRYRALSAEESERRLTALLLVPIPGEKKDVIQPKPIEEFRSFVKRPDGQAALTQLQSDLLNFSLHANPLLQPIVNEYRKVVSLLARGKTGGCAEKLRALADDRQKIARRMTEIADYLNWFEASKIPTRSNSFDGYFKAAATESAIGPKRSDPISRYIDTIELQLE